METRVEALVTDSTEKYEQLRKSIDTVKEDVEARLKEVESKQKANWK